MPSRLEREAERELARLDGRNERRRIEAGCGLDFASNDYLALRRDPRVVEAARRVLAEEGAGAGGARLLRGDHPAHRALELAVAAHYGCEDGLLYPSGFHANLGVLPVFAGAGWTILSDAQNHASIIEGCRASGARTVVVPHNDVEAFAERANEKTILVTEAAFSMSGDRAPLEELSRIRARTGAALVVDEAHAVGLLPPTGEADVRIVPCGKALGAAGAVVAGPHAVIELLRSRSRPFLFTTAPPPSVAAAAHAALAIARAEPERAARALSLARALDPAAQSCIVAVPCPDNESALRAQSRLREQGFDVRAVRPPSVPRAMLRISVHADRTDGEVAALREALASS